MSNLKDGDVLCDYSYEESHSSMCLNAPLSKKLRQYILRTDTEQSYIHSVL